jgi:hypothetical protein
MKQSTNEIDYGGVRSAALALIEGMPATSRGVLCPMCGQLGPHDHTPEEAVIFVNGAKFGYRFAGTVDRIKSGMRSAKATTIRISGD